MRFDENDRDDDRPRSQRCPKCRRGFQVLADEGGQHACQHCGYGAPEDTAEEVDPDDHGAALFDALKDLVLRVDQTELADGSSINTMKAHAALELIEPGEWL